MEMSPGHRSVLVTTEMKRPIGFQKSSHAFLFRTQIGILWSMATSELGQRILVGAGELFYREGINGTGVNRLAEHLGVSKRTMYELFGSKDQIVAQALAAMDSPTREQFTAGAEAATDDPAEQLVAIFVVLEQWLGAPDFRGCPFLNAAAELPDPHHPARRVAAEHKEQLRRWMEHKARNARLGRPKALSQQLMVLFDGLLSQASVGQANPRVTIDAARTLVNAATVVRPGTSRSIRGR